MFFLKLEYSFGRGVQNLLISKAFNKGGALKHALFYIQKGVFQVALMSKMTAQVAPKVGCLCILLGANFLSYLTCASETHNLEKRQAQAISPLVVTEPPSASGVAIRASRSRSYDYVTVAKSQEIKIMTYNVENLFDTVHDEGKNDYEFLPLSHSLKSRCYGPYKRLCLRRDWSPEVLRTKIHQLARVVESSGSLPDVLGLQEVENIGVLQAFADRLGYQGVSLIEGPDQRGIDVAALYKEEKLQLLEQNAYSVSPINPKGRATRATRDVLELVFKVKQNQRLILAVYVNHWPSQGTPNSGWKRRNAARAMMQAITQLHARYASFDVHAMAIGDFNTLPEDRPHPFHSVLYAAHAPYTMEYPVGWYFRKHPQFASARKAHRKMPLGTYYYLRELRHNFLDRIFTGRRLHTGPLGLRVLIESYRIVSPDFASHVAEAKVWSQRKRFTVPLRYNGKVGTQAEGAADHFPVTVLLRLE